MELTLKTETTKNILMNFTTIQLVSNDFFEIEAQKPRKINQFSFG